MILNDLPKLKAVIFQDDWEWLQNSSPLYADAIAKEVKGGATPEQIYRALMRELGPHREALALRCRHAAQHLSQNGDQ